MIIFVGTRRFCHESTIRIVAHTVSVIADKYLIHDSKIYLTDVNMSLDMTRLSEKGQIVIPNEMRKRMGLKEGTRFLVIGLDNTIVLRRLELSQEKMRLKQLLEKSRVKAERVGFTGKEIDRLIHSYRKVS